MILNRPHPFIFTKISVLVPGLVALLVIILMAPFSFNEFSFPVRLGFGVLFGIIASLCVLTTVLILKKMVPAQVIEESWTVGKELVLILIVVVLICLVNFFVVFFFEISSSGFWDTFLLVVVYTFLISIFPVTIMVLAEQLAHQRSKLDEASKLTNRLKKKIEDSKIVDEDSPGARLSLVDENGNKELELESQQILYFRSDGNYVEVFFKSDEASLKKKLIRNRLKYFADYLQGEDFFQCHKSYIVNKRNIQSVTGNARNFELILSDNSVRIPVSRSKTSELKEIFQA